MPADRHALLVMRPVASGTRQSRLCGSFLACALLLLAPSSVSATTNLSAWAYPGSSGRLLQQPDALGNRVLDYSGVGYQGGTVPIPDVPVRVILSPVSGDDGASIQAAINTVKGLPLDTNGFRGAVLLTAGQYEISNSITIDASGIVLRGVGDGLAGTVLRATGTNQRTLVVVSGSGSASTVSGTTHNITNHYVPVGARSFDVDSTSKLAVGDRVFVRRIATDPWIRDLGMDLLCCPPDVNPWTVSGYHIDADRLITRIEGNHIMVDAPLTCAIEAKYAGGTIREFTWAGRISRVGIEDIRGDSDYAAADDEAHGWVFIRLGAVENVWVRRVTSEHFGYACVQLSGGTRAATVRDCKSLNPVSIITGSRRYAFPMDDCTLCLVQNCYTLKDRHQFVTQSLTTGPNVFVDGLSDTAYSDAGPHHRWGTGAIWDNVIVNGNNLDVQNRGNSGSGHGWAGANEVVWNCDANSFIVQNPPTARNWLIGSIGPIRNGTMYVGPHDPGTYDSHGSNVFPNSLYYAQLQDRLAAPNLQTREYWLGDIDQFLTSSPAGDVVPVDSAWRAAIQTEAAGGKVSGFDIVTNNHWVPFTFNFTLGTTDRVVAAALTLALRGHNANATNRVLYVEGTTNKVSFTSLGWPSLATGTNTTVGVLDLRSQLGLLSDGKLNVAVADDVAVDWAMLELQVGLVVTTYTNVFVPAADAYVRGGTYAANNYGSSSAIDIKADTSADNSRVGYFRWDLSGFPARVLHARVRLTPVSVGTNGLEHGVTLAASNDWSGTTINWNNQPGGGKRFATWIPAVNASVEFVVTPQVQAALAEDGQLSLELFSLKNVGGPGLVSYASSEDSDPSRRPHLLLVVTNPVPSISFLSDRAISINTNTDPLPFTVGDPVYAASLLSVHAVSANPNLVPQGGLVLAGSSSNRTLTLTPSPDRIGSALITVTVSNPAGMTALSPFTLTVTNAAGTNSVPTISPINDQSIAANSNAGPVPFTIGDPFYAVNLLTVGAASANTNLVPQVGLDLSGSLSNRMLTVTPSLGQTGSAIITVIVTNPAGLTAASQFILTVTNGGGISPGSGSWLLDASGDWNNGANWAGGIIATGVGMTAIFAIDVTASRYVNNNSSRTLGKLTFNDTNPGSAGAWFISNSPITLQVSNGTPTISVSNVTAAINAVLDGSQGLASQGNGTLWLGAANLYRGGTTISSGALRAANNSALGSNANGTTVGNDPTARLELMGGITVAEPLTVSCKGSANGNVPAVVNISGTNTLSGSISLTTGGSYWTFQAAGGKLRVTGNTTNTTTVNVRTIWLRGAAEGDWLSVIGDSAAALSTAIRKDDSGTWMLSGDNTYTGNTVVSNGTLRVNGKVRGASVSVYAGTLSGTGVITAPVTIYAGATFAPGASPGTLTISNDLTLSAGGVTAIGLNAQTGTSDRVNGLSNVLYAGTLSITDLAGPPTGGQSFQLFSAAGSSGTFDSISPATPGPGLAWSFNPTNGTLSVLSLGPLQINDFAIGAEGSFNLAGTGPNGQGYRVLAATNVTLPLSNWTALSTGVFTGGVFHYSDTQSTNHSQRYYRVAMP